MQLPVQITFRGMDHSDVLEAHARRRAAKLDRFFDRITACHVVIEAAHKRHRHGRRHRVSIAIAVPRGELAVVCQSADDQALEDAYAAVDEAFNDAERRVEEWARRMRDQRRGTPRAAVAAQRRA